MHTVRWIDFRYVSQKFFLRTSVIACAKNTSTSSEMRTSRNFRYAGSSNVLTLDHPLDSGGIRGSPNSETRSFSVKSLHCEGSTPLAYAARINVDTTTALATVPPRIRAGLGC